MSEVIRINDLVSISEIARNDVILIEDVSQDKTRKIPVKDVLQAAYISLPLEGQVVLDWSVSNVFVKEISANTTFTMSNLIEGTILLKVSSTGSFTVAFTNPAGHTIEWAYGSQPPQTANKTDIYTFLKIGNKIYASANQNFNS